MSIRDVVKINCIRADDVAFVFIWGSIGKFVTNKKNGYDKKCTEKGMQNCSI